MTVAGASSRVAPLPTMWLGAGSDPFLSLVLGFGTAYPASRELGPAGPGAHDYMITAHWARGLDGGSPPLDYAAIIPAPGAAAPPAPPANMVCQHIGFLRPPARDGDWRLSNRISWDRPPDFQLFRNASFALARAGISPPQASQPLVDKRVSGGFRPIAINRATTNPPDPEPHRLHAIDKEIPIPSSPGMRSAKYGAAVQDIYGQWTPWVSVADTASQPDPEEVRIVNARMTTTVPGSGASCPATLEIEFLWDWRVRTPQTIRFAGRLYAAADHGSPPPSLVVPGGLDRSVGGGGALLAVTFLGDTPSAPGATVVGLNEGGDQQVAFGPAQGDESRRYRLTLAGLSLDFALSGHIGLALWAQCTERIPPARTSAWSTNPLVIATSDPRPPVVPVDHVTLASLPDAGGQCHARISWAVQPNAIGYFVYESDETQLLDARGLPQPLPSQTLDDRLLVIEQAFTAAPAALRRNFTRLNSTPVKDGSIDVALPKGSTAIHVYVVLGSSAGQIESDWPGGPDAKDSLIAVAAPRVMNPAPPTLEVQRYLDQTSTPPVFKARLQITTRPGPRAAKIDLHRVRVDDAAADLDTMGPPIARLVSSGGGFTVNRITDPRYGSYIQSAQGTDAPSGSWRRVWYRATAWTDRDDTRGGLAGRSPASTAAWVVIPPPDGPEVSKLSLGSGPTPPDVVVQWTSAAPLARTPLGAHVVTVRAALAGAPLKTDPLLSVDAALDRLPSAPPASGSGVWIFAKAAGLVTYRALIRRAAVTDPVRCAVRITDPLGRTGEALADIPGGPVNPAPDLGGLVVHKIVRPPARPLLALEFRSQVPLVAPLDGPFRVMVMATLRGPTFPPRPPLVVEMPVGNVPTVPPPETAPLDLYRLAGPGPVVTYVAITPVSTVAQFRVRITGPDGRFAAMLENVS
jgi:hypothetical protein